MDDIREFRMNVSGKKKVEQIRETGAEYVAAGFPFMCQWCWNQDIDGRFREVDFPAAYDALDVVLTERIEPENRNWTPGETVADLQVENIAHGVGA